MTSDEVVEKLSKWIGKPHIFFLPPATRNVKIISPDNQWDRMFYEHTPYTIINVTKEDEASISIRFKEFNTTWYYSKLYYPYFERGGSGKKDIDI
jgi:hypothetical protein